MHGPPRYACHREHELTVGLVIPSEKRARDEFDRAPADAPQHGRQRDELVGTRTAARNASALMPSTRDNMSSSHSISSSLLGASEKPQLPVITVVTPCHDAGEAVGSQCNCAS